MIHSPASLLNESPTGVRRTRAPCGVVARPTSDVGWKVRSGADAAGGLHAASAASALAEVLLELRLALVPELLGVVVRDPSLGLERCRRELELALTRRVVAPGDEEEDPLGRGLGRGAQRPAVGELALGQGHASDKHLERAVHLGLLVQDRVGPDELHVLLVVALRPAVHDEGELALAPLHGHQVQRQRQHLVAPALGLSELELALLVLLHEGRVAALDHPLALQGQAHDAAREVLALELVDREVAAAGVEDVGVETDVAHESSLPRGR